MCLFNRLLVVGVAYAIILTAASTLCARAALATVGIPAAQTNSYDLRADGYVTAVKDQRGGTCWTHGTMAAMESNLLMNGNWVASGEAGEPNLAEYHLDWWNGFNEHNNDDVIPTSGGLTVHRGGEYKIATAYVSRGDGAVRDVDGQSFEIPPARYSHTYHRYYARDVEWFALDDHLTNIDTIKEAVWTHGAVATAIAYSKHFTIDNVHYQPPADTSAPTHSIAIVGWDNDKPTHAPQPGAWLCKNSWGTGWGESGYFWISYYDKCCCRHPEVGAVSFQNVEPLAYEHIYYHDYHGWRDTLQGCTEAFNAFWAGDFHTIEAVSFYTAVHYVIYRVKIYDRFENGELLDELSSQSGTIDRAGFHTVDLPRPVPVGRGDDFYVYVELLAGGHPYDRTSEIEVLLDGASANAGFQTRPTAQDGPGAFREASVEDYRRLGKFDAESQAGVTVESRSHPGQSYYRIGSGWHDLYDLDSRANFCIKALANETVLRSVSPLDGASGVSTDVTLQWVPGPKASSVDLYLGTDFDDVNSADNSWPIGSSVYKGNMPVDANSYEPGGLELDTAYYWRIDEVKDSDAFRPVKGKVWRFTTSNVVHVPAQYLTIQQAIDSACSDVIIIVAPGTYLDNLDFKGKRLTIKSADPNVPAAVAATVIKGRRQCPTVTFSSGEDISSGLIGLTIANGGTGIFCSGTTPRIAHCRILNNGVSAIKLWNGSNPTISDCIIAGNAGDGIEMWGSWGGGSAPHSSATISNCIIAGNRMYGIRGGEPTMNNCTIVENLAIGIVSRVPTISNSIIYYNGSSLYPHAQIESDFAKVSYSNIQGGWPGIGNIHTEPYFVKLGFWVDPRNHSTCVPSDYAGAVWTEGDYHLRSEGWRWDIGRGVWTWDEITSRCVDAGNPCVPLGAELLAMPDDPNNEWGQNIRIDMGAYGGTPEASLPPYDWALLSDLTNDGTVNLHDFVLQAVNWHGSAEEGPGDLSRNGFVDDADLALLANDWLKNTRGLQ